MGFPSIYMVYFPWKGNHLPSGWDGHWVSPSGWLSWMSILADSLCFSNLLRCRYSAWWMWVEMRTSGGFGHQNGNSERDVIHITCNIYIYYIHNMHILYVIYILYYIYSTHTDKPPDCWTPSFRNLSKLPLSLIPLLGPSSIFNRSARCIIGSSATLQASQGDLTISNFRGLRWFLQWLYILMMI